MKKLVVVFVGFFVLACASPQKDSIVNSPNFKQGAFQNSQNFKMHSFWEMFKHGLSSDIERAVWPEWLDTNTDNKPVARVNDASVRITYVNHATFLIQTGGVNILTDPVFSERTSPLSFIGPKRIHNPGIEMQMLPKIDVIIISHDHYDHLDLDSIDKLVTRDDPQIYMGLGVGERLSESAKTTELDWWQRAQVNDKLQLWFVDVQHFSGRTLTDRNSTLWGGFLLQINDQNIYFGGDSGYASHYQRTFERFGPIDIAFLPIGAYAPRELFKPIHLDPTEAVRAHTDLRSKLSIGMHYGTFQLSAEARTEPVELLELAKQKAGIAPSDFITLEIGRPFTLPHQTSASGVQHPVTP